MLFLDYLYNHILCYFVYNIPKKYKYFQSFGQCDIKIKCNVCKSSNIGKFIKMFAPKKKIKLYFIKIWLLSSFSNWIQIEKNCLEQDIADKYELLNSLCQFFSINKSYRSLRITKVSFDAVFTIKLNLLSVFFF